MNPKLKFKKICKDIKSIKIQGARNIAKKALYAYKLIPTKKTKKNLFSLRPTEPMLQNILKIADKISYQELENRLNENQQKINEEIFKLIKNGFVIFTHCHSSTIVEALIYSKKKRKKFEIYNTETRPLYQGRKTTKELKKAGIKVTLFIDSAAEVAITKEQDKEEKTKPADIVLFGADAILKKGAINKVGSGMIAKIANLNKIPVYIVSDSLKYSNKNISLEQRGREEIWKTKSKIKIVNPAFEFIEKKNIAGIISEFGNLSYSDFLRKIR